MVARMSANCSLNRFYPRTLCSLNRSYCYLTEAARDEALSSRCLAVTSLTRHKWARGVQLVTRRLQENPLEQSLYAERRMQVYAI